MMSLRRLISFADRPGLIVARRMLYLLFLAVFLLSATFQIRAQTAPGGMNVSGKVTDLDDRRPISGVHVVVKNDNTIVAVTDAEGNYTLGGVPSDVTLVFSSLGMENLEIPVDGRSRIDATMDVAAYMIDDITIVSIGYGTVRKRDLTGSIASISGEDISAYSNTTIAQALQGRLPGVEVRSTNSEPAAAPQIRIRGTNSIGGGNNPLWVVDGFIGDANMLNPSDIESIEVLKDASATAIYGSRGSNGVIIVTTKQGRDGKTQVDYNGSIAFATLAKKMDMMNAQEYMRFQNTLYANEGAPGYFSVEEVRNAGKGFDWQDAVYRTALTHDHSVSVKGGNAKTRFSAGVSYYDQEGIVRGNGYKRVNLRSSINHDISSKVNIAANLMYSRAVHDQQAGVTLAALRASPTLDGYNDDGTYRDLSKSYPFSTPGLVNPEVLINERSEVWTSNRTMANAAVTYKPVRGLTLRTALNANIAGSREEMYMSKKNPHNTNGNGSVTMGESIGITSETTVTYAVKFGEHDLSIMGGVVYEDDLSKSMGVSATGFLTDYIDVYGIPSATTINTPELPGPVKWTMFSLMGRVNYSFRDKYLLTATYRGDGSSRFSKGSKWGYFPSVSAAWRINEEGFLKDVRILNMLKLRVGYGIVGNPAISPYQTLDLLTPNDVVFGKDVYKAYSPSNYYKFGLVWEKTGGWDVGLDLGLWNNRLSVTADWYYKHTYQLINTVEMPGSSGYISGEKNIGTLRNVGFEFLVNARAIDTSVKWDISLNGSFNRNRVTQLPFGEDVYGAKRGITFINDYINLVREGRPIGIFYGYVEDGYDDRGLVKYVDYDENGEINEEDKRIIGDPNPTCTFGFNTSVSWKGITFSAYIQGVFGNDIYSLSIAEFGYNYSSNRGRNAFADVLGNTWTPGNPNSKYPVLSTLGTGSLRMSDRFVYNGSYVRLRNIELAYSIPVQRVSWLRSATVYVSAQNLLTITSYPFFNPDVNTYGGSSSVNQGVDYLSYPLAKGYTAGVRILF